MRQTLNTRFFSLARPSRCDLKLLHFRSVSRGLMQSDLALSADGLMRQICSFTSFLIRTQVLDFVKNCFITWLPFH